MYTPLDSYINLDSDLWRGVKDVAELFVYNGKHYYVPYQLDTNFALNYNNRVLEENGIADPMKMFQEGTWDWNAFESICKQWKDNNFGFAAQELQSLYELLQLLSVM